MKEFIVRRNGQIIGVLTANEVPIKDDRLVFDGSEYVVIARKIIFHTHKAEKYVPIITQPGEPSDDGFDPQPADGTIMQIDPPEVHVNHIRVLIEGIHNG